MKCDMQAAAARLGVVGDPQDANGMLELLAFLFDTGRSNLALGRLIEGHVDAMQIITRYGNHAQRSALQENKNHNLYGVWNAGDYSGPLILQDGKLSGGKLFASGFGILTHALVTANCADEPAPQLVLLPLDHIRTECEDGWWDVTGMQQSSSHRVSWDAATIPLNWHVGAPGDYETQPWFSAGALRFVAVQVGGIAAVADTVITHLNTLGRSDDPHQQARLGTLHGLLQSCRDSVRAAAHAAFAETEEAFRARIASLRCFVSDSAERAIILAERCVGVQSGFRSCPVSRSISDLRVYIRQPGPDAQRVLAGKAYASGLLDIEFQR